MLNVGWLPVEGETCGKPLRRKNKKAGKIHCELPPDHKTKRVGGYRYPMHLGRDVLGRWRTW